MSANDKVGSSEDIFAATKNVEIKGTMLFKWLNVQSVTISFGAIPLERIVIAVRMQRRRRDENVSFSPVNTSIYRSNFFY